MKVVRQEQWLKQVDEFESSELGHEFGRFLVEWAEEAERMMVSEDLSAIEALRLAIVVTEENLGNAHLRYIGEMLAVLVANWEFGEAMVYELTTLEMKIMATPIMDRMKDVARESVEKK